MLRESAETFSLDAVGGLAAAGERELLVQLFFSFKQPRSKSLLTRAGTLGQLLHVIKAYEDIGFEIPRISVDRLVLVWPLYFGSLEVDNMKSVPYEPAPALLLMQALWRQFCAHQFLAVALEEFLAAALDILAAHPPCSWLQLTLAIVFRFPRLTPFEILRRGSLRYAAGIPFSQSRTTPSREWRPNFSSLSHALVLARLESSAVAAAPAQLVSATAYHIILLKNLIYAFYAQCEI
jgi:hypothetical protein